MELTKMCFNMKKLLLILIISSAGMSMSCSDHVRKEGNPTIGSIERYDDELDQIIPVNSKIYILADGFEWSEGPVWIPGDDYLLFSDIPPNRIYKWSEDDGIELYLEPSGYTGMTARKGEPGSNGLLLDREGNLILCQHGDRRIAKMNASLSDPRPVFITLADMYEGKRLNSPNDACYHSNGNLYFTDPPYGLEGNVNDPAKELDFQGVFMLQKDSTLHLLTSNLTRPNGIALSPDERTLYVANSDPQKAIWMSYNVKPDGTLDQGRIFHDATDMVGKAKGLPDGMKINEAGYIFSTGPGGVWVFNPQGEHLGTINTTQATANCAFNTDQSVLYITADMYLLCVELKTSQ
jgi:gluconolactonase